MADDTTRTRSDDGEGFFPIRTVASLTGVNPITLRAWERRYGLIRPHRTPKGHRLYTQDDIDLINEVVNLLEEGIPISRVRQRLEKRDQGSETAEGEADAWQTYRRRMYNAVARFDDWGVDAAYNEALALYPIDMVTEHLLRPLLRELGERWHEHDGGIAEEHFFGTYLRNKLGARFHHLSPRADGPRLLLACLPGEQHELGLMLFALSAADHGFRCILLGANTPLAELPPALRRSGARALILSSSVEPERGVIERELPDLVAAAGVPVFIGGDTAVHEHDAFQRAGAIPLGNEIPTALRHLQKWRDEQPATE